VTTPPSAAVVEFASAVPLPILHRKSPLFATLAAQQQNYIALYGVTGFTPPQV
jgi:hypothetical protein